MFVRQHRVVSLSHRLRCRKHCAIAALQFVYWQELLPCKLVYGYFTLTPAAKIPQFFQIAEPYSIPRSFVFEGVPPYLCYMWPPLAHRKLGTSEKKNLWLASCWRQRVLASWSNSAAMQLRQRDLPFVCFFCKGGIFLLPGNTSPIVESEVAFFIEWHRNCNVDTCPDPARTRRCGAPLQLLVRIDE